MTAGAQIFVLLIDIWIWDCQKHRLFQRCKKSLQLLRCQESEIQSNCDTTTALSLMFWNLSLEQWLFFGSRYHRYFCHIVASFFESTKWCSKLETNEVKEIKYFFSKFHCFFHQEKEPWGSEISGEHFFLLFNELQTPVYVQTAPQQKIEVKKFYI